MHKKKPTRRQYAALGFIIPYQTLLNLISLGLLGGKSEPRIFEIAGVLCL
jgi:hypothetical protein